MPSFWRYKENYVSCNAPEKFQDFWEMGPSRVTGVANEERVIDHNTVEECMSFVHPIEVQIEKKPVVYHSYQT